MGHYKTVMLKNRPRDAVDDFYMLVRFLYVSDINVDLPLSLSLEALFDFGFSHISYNSLCFHQIRRNDFPS